MLKDGSLEINNLAVNDCLSYKKVFQNGVNALSVIVKEIVKKLIGLCNLNLSYGIRFCSNFTRMSYKHLVRNVWRVLRDLGLSYAMSALSMVAGKSFSDKFTSKIDFPVKNFCYHC